MARTLPQQVVRRSGRIPKEISIILIGSDLTGRIFSEETKTVLLSLHGAGLLSRHKLSPEQEMVLRWPERNKEAEIRVVGQIGENCGTYTYGVAFFDSVVNFWEMEFPPPSPKEQELGVLTLVCSVCQSFDRVDDRSIEADVVATNEGVLRYCKRCGNSTIWKPGQPGALPAAPAHLGVPSPGPLQPPKASDGAASTCIVAARVLFGIWSCKSRFLSRRASTWSRWRVRIFSVSAIRLGCWWNSRFCCADFRNFSVPSSAANLIDAGFFSISNLCPDSAYRRTACGKITIALQKGGLVIKIWRSGRQSAQVSAHHGELHWAGPPRRAW